MRKNPRRILSPQRLPFRHPGNGRFKSSEYRDSPQHPRFPPPTAPRNTLFFVLVCDDLFRFPASE